VETQTLRGRPPLAAAGRVADAAFQAAAGKLAGVSVDVHYELYDGIPVLSKWLTITNGGSQAVTLDSFVSEILAAVEYGSDVGVPPQWECPNIHVAATMRSAP